MGTTTKRFYLIIASVQFNLDNFGVVSKTMIIISFFLPLISAQERHLNKKTNQTGLKITHSEASVYCRELNPAAEEQKSTETAEGKTAPALFLHRKPSPPGQNRPGNGTGRCLWVKGGGLGVERRTVGQVCVRAARRLKSLFQGTAASQNSSSL